MASSLTVQYTAPVPSAGNAREHHMVRARRVKKQRGQAFLELRAKAQGSDFAGPLVVTLTRISPRFLDVGDNLPASLKSYRDGVADWLGIADNDPRVTWAYSQERGSPQGVRIEVRAV